MIDLKSEFYKCIDKCFHSAFEEDVETALIDFAEKVAEAQRDADLLDATNLVTDQLK